MVQKKIKIGFDLDGVIIGKPFFVPQYLMEALVRSKKNDILEYRYPSSKFERLVRYLSHHPILRPPIRENITLIRELSKSKKYQLYAISSRYCFLEERTKQWFRFYKLRKFFKEIYINIENEQPHLYKERMIKKLKLNALIDDDKPLLEYLKKRVKNIDLIYVSDNQNYFTDK
jgi:hypothetical protein